MRLTGHNRSLRVVPVPAITAVTASHDALAPATTFFIVPLLYAAQLGSPTATQALLTQACTTRPQRLVDPSPSTWCVASKSSGTSVPGVMYCFCFWFGPSPRVSTREWNLGCCLQVDSGSSTSVVWDDEDSAAASETDGAPTAESDGQAQTSATSPEPTFADSPDPFAEEGAEGDQDSGTASADSPEPSLREANHNSENVSAEAPSPSPTPQRKYSAAYTYQVGEGICGFDQD